MDVLCLYMHGLLNLSDQVKTKLQVNMTEATIRAALFDLDGVVFDTESQYTVFWREQCMKYHSDKPGLENKIKGQTLLMIFDKYFSDLKDEQPKIVERLNEFERNMKFEYVAGFNDFIINIHERGIKSAVVTSSNLMKMRSVYAIHGEFKQLFDAILTSEDFERSKPDPDCYYKGATALGVKPEECLVFEDSFNGLKAGRAAGMTVVGLSTTNSAEDIKPYSDYVIPDFRHIPLSLKARLL